MPKSITSIIKLVNKEEKLINSTSLQFVSLDSKEECYYALLQHYLALKGARMVGYAACAHTIRITATPSEKIE